MEVINKDLTLELLSIFGLLGSAWVISTTLGKNLFNYEYKFLDITIFKRIFKPRNKIKNIYQLIPILQKNTKKLFLLFSDLSTSLRSMNGIIINREIIENILSQEYYERKFIEIQTEVFNEFNVDFHDVYNSIKLFQNVLQY
uniref:Uncharacterized protein n=1 Tax=Theileria annulata TaxID=5874 RepID=A0A3B0MJK5_THEAN